MTEIKLNYHKTHQRGKQLLIQNTKNISEIAYELGFSSPSYFAKCFKDFYAESPKEFLEKLNV